MQEDKDFKQMVRQRIYEIIEVSKEDDKQSRAYDIFMILTIVIGLIPLTQKSTIGVFNIMDKVTVVIFIIDYVLRLYTADFKLNKGKMSFVLYPFTFLAIIDLLSILPSISILPRGLKTLRILRLLRAMRVFRAFRAFRYSKNVEIIVAVFRRQRDSLLAVCWLAIGYILVSALIIFNVEPDTFGNFFEAVYWATVSLTTVGYGDIYAVSTVGKAITMISAIFGIAIVALPAGIITAGYMKELERSRDDNDN